MSRAVRRLSLGHAMRAGTALLLALLAGAAVAADTPGWADAASPDGVLAASTPCSPAEIAAMRGLPSEATGRVPIAGEARVLCRKGQQIFLAGTVREPNVPAGSTLFDQIVTRAQADPTAEGAPRLTRLSGRRAFVNRQQQGDAIAQTGFVDVDRTTVVLVVAGIQAGSGIAPDVQAGMVDRFFGSVRVTPR